MNFATVEVERTSPFSGTRNVMTFAMTPDEFRARLARWHNGEMIQVAFSNLNADEREFIKTGITPQEWEETFGSGE